MTTDTFIRVFVGSATETVDLSVELAAMIDDEEQIRADHWRDLFRPGETTIEALERAIREYDYAVFVADADDSLIRRGQDTPVTRDNVVLEFGMFVGSLGRARTALLVPDDAQVVLPSDLQGVTVSRWPAKRRSDPQSAMRAVAARLLRDIKALGPYSPTAAIAPVGRNGDGAAAPADGHRRGEMFDSFVDAALYIKDERLARTEIREHIANKRLIPSRYHYSSDAGASRWLGMCEESVYEYNIDTVQFWARPDGTRFAEQIRQEIGSDAFDYVSLGPGDGQKDADLLTSWMNSDAELYYYPYDVSLLLAARSARHVRDSTKGCEAGSLRVKAVLADFEHVDKIAEVFRDRKTPNVVAMLGGTLGNLRSEIAFLRRLHRTMGARDLLMLEVRLKADYKELETEKSLLHDFGPLEYYLQLPFEIACMNVAPLRERGSEVRNTTTVAVTYNGGRRNDLDLSNVQLQYVQMYEPDDFIEAVKGIGFDVVAEYRGEKFLECVLRRRTETRK